MNDTHRIENGDRAATTSRHVSMRVPVELYERLEGLADNSNESVSQCARRLLTDGLEAPDRYAIDAAISALLLMRRQLSEHDRVTEYGAPLESRVVNILNAKTDLQHLIDDVGRGVEIIITHAGAQRARLVPIGAPHGSRAPRAE